MKSNYVIAAIVVVVIVAFFGWMFMSQNKTADTTPAPQVTQQPQASDSAMMNPDKTATADAMMMAQEKEFTIEG